MPRLIEATRATAALLDAQRTRLNVRIDANDSSTQLLLSTVQLFKALGGGWEAFEPGAT